MRTHSEPQGKAMYVASQSDKDWLLSVQRKLYTQSQKDLSYVFEKLWGFITDSRNLRVAFARVARNKGRRTAGADRVTVAHVVAKRHKARERQRSVAGARGELGGRERPRRGIVRAR